MFITEVHVSGGFLMDYNLMTCVFPDGICTILEKEKYNIANLIYNLNNKYTVKLLHIWLHQHKLNSYIFIKLEFMSDLLY